MSITLLEIAVAIVLLVVAWQIGLIIAPWIFQKLWGLKRDLDEVADEARPDRTEPLRSNHQDDSGSNHSYRNN